MIDPSVNDLLNRGNPFAKFLTIETVVKGTVMAATSRQQTDFDTGKPLFWDDGNPRMQLVITLATAERDPEIPNDDGVRDLYVKANMLTAVREALKATSGQLEVGGMLAVKYTGDGEKKGNKNPPKLYQAQYKPPVSTGVTDLLGDTPAASQTSADSGGSSQPAPTQPAATDLI